MTKRYQITETAKAEVEAVFGLIFAGCVLAEVQRRKGERWFAPVGVNGTIEAEAKPLFADQIEEVR